MVPKLATKDAIQAEKLALLPEIQDQSRVEHDGDNREKELGTSRGDTFLASSVSRELPGPIPKNS